MAETLSKIVVGYDLSESSKDAVRVAANLARAVGASLYLVTSVPGHLSSEQRVAIEPRGPVHHEIPFDYEQRLQENVQARIRSSLADLDLSGIDVKFEVPVEVKPTRPFVSLIDMANFVDADLIVVGATGRGRIKRWLVGSTAEKLVRKSRYPVLVVRPGQEIVIKHILCPVDFSDASTRALGFAAMLSRVYGSEIDIFHVMEPVVSPQVEALVGLGRLSNVEVSRLKSEAEARANERFDELVQSVDLTDVKWNRIFEEGIAEFVIVDRTEEKHYDLITMGSLGRGFLKGMLIGNTAEKVLRSLPASLLTVKPDEFVLKHRFFRKGR